MVCVLMKIRTSVTNAHIINHKSNHNVKLFALSSNNNTIRILNNAKISVQLDLSMFPIQKDHNIIAFNAELEKLSINKKENANLYAPMARVSIGMRPINYAKPVLKDIN